MTTQEIKQLEEAKKRLILKTHPEIGLLIDSNSQLLEELKKLNEKEINVESPNVEVKPADVIVEKINIEPIISSIKALESVVVDFLKELVSYINQIIFWITEPDELVIDKDGYTEIYGQKKVTYLIERKQGKISRILRNES